MTGLLSNRSAIITGGSQGFGLAVAEAYVKQGANVMICGRDSLPLEDARERLQRIASAGQIVRTRVADVSQADSVREFVKDSLNTLPKVQILINNAGVYGPKGQIVEVDWNEWVRAIEINLFGSILLCRELLPHFMKNRYGKIIQLSGGGATNPLPRLSAYAASKAGIVRFAETLAEEVREYQIDVNSIAPGALNTRLLDEVLEAGPAKVGRTFYERALAQKSTGGAPVQKGADLAVFLGSEASDGITGKLISAIWDPWETFTEHKSELAATDIYTLRRIIPKERGYDWGER